MIYNISKFYSLPLWLQIYFQMEQNPCIRCLFRKTSKIFNNPLLLITIDIDHAASKLKLGWYQTNKNYILIADDSEWGIKEYNYYNNMYESAKQFLISFNFIR